MTEQLSDKLQWTWYYQETGFCQKLYSAAFCVFDFKYFEKTFSIVIKVVDRAHLYR